MMTASDIIATCPSRSSCRSCAAGRAGCTLHNSDEDRHVLVAVVRICVIWESEGSGRR